ncbi:SDR family NAD(P)-dependent oxidoreductase [Halalkalibacter sp. APA_J-10(15)]|uniref:SDR family NAD(P)-dependent oxidoreductase n=1 Tax=unclassified Halalkalibacter TaxID=2893063 RepID=UPI001FF26B9B|nr:SDR family NAD(P)-dependent oxidoreductase [Halalkalibacter sp. APA_J-10(15)]MCK0471621.1 SDR family NAD(P)-dependent oxidoreductase [Halalkalibacter sp. APA_J-10(15)]
MKRVLVIGASGSIGYALVNELVNRGWEVIAFARNEEKLRSLFGHHDHVTIQSGDARNKQDIAKAAKGVEVLFHSLNFPYHQWEENLFICLQNILSVAEESDSKVAYVDNVYAYGIPSRSPITESVEKRPHTKKGKIRLALEQRLMTSSVPTLLVHMPDVYGPNANGTILHETLKSVVKGQTGIFVGNLRTKREFLYTIDGAKAMVELSLRDDCYNQIWNIPSTHSITGYEIMKLLRTEVSYNKKIIPISKAMIRFMGLFSPLMRELVEMMYISETPIILSGEKYENEIGALPKTPYQVGLIETIEWLKKHD